MGEFRNNSPVFYILHSTTKPYALIIMSSGFGMDELTREALDPDDDFFIQKSYTCYQSSKAIRDLFSDG